MREPALFLKFIWKGQKPRTPRHASWEPMPFQESGGCVNKGGSTKRPVGWRGQHHKRRAQMATWLRTRAVGIPGYSHAQINKLHLCSQVSLKTENGTLTKLADLQMIELQQNHM